MATIVKLPDATIQRIAAGEVITKPVNVIKELLENSLDAGATCIRINLEECGLKLIEITDNGQGIAKINAELLCQRYSTSKINSAADLTALATFGFRGEALASISEMGDVDVITKLKGTAMGWRAKYRNGKLIGKASDTYYNGTGTNIRVTNLFSSALMRKRALQANYSEEKKLIGDLVMRYAIHNRDKVTLSLTEPDGDILNVLSPMKLRPCLGYFYGTELEKNVMECDAVNNHQYKAKAKVVFAYKRAVGCTPISNSIIFVNNRLVECNDLRRELELLANEYFGKKQNVFVFFVSLDVPPQDVDVNTHPSKATVALHYQDEIVALIITALRAKFRDNLVDQKIIAHAVQPSPTTQLTFSSLEGSRSSSQVSTASLNHQRLQLLAPGSLAQSSPSSLTNSPITQRRPHDLIHNDSAQQTLNQLSGANKTRPNAKRSTTDPIEPWPDTNSDMVHPKVNTYQEISSGSIADSTSTYTYSSSIASPPHKLPPMEPKERRRDLRLRSIMELMKQVKREKSISNTRTIKDSTFVGLFDHDRALIQNGTKLYAINLRAYLKEQYYQFYLFDFGNFPPIQILPPGNKIQFIVETYLKDIEKHEPSEFESLKFKTTKAVIEKLQKHMAMLSDYLSLKFTNREIISIPCIMPDEIPNLAYLGKFLVNLANQVDYTEERNCFRQMGRVVADFYSQPPANLKNLDVHKKYHEVIESKLYVAIKNYLFAPEWLFTKENICQITDTKDLYKVFERC